MQEQIRQSIERVTYYESLFDELSAAVTALRRAVGVFAEKREIAAQLAEYYQGTLWKQDFSADEAGLLPRDLKRGVLSEDGLYDLLEEADMLEQLTEAL